MMTKRLPIKPGCLCLVLSGADSIPNVVGPGSIVTAVQYIGHSRNLAGQVFNDVWQITNPAIEAALHRRPLCIIGCSARYLQPINDPDLKLPLALESVQEEPERQTSTQLP
jgi:hypothetical protein